MMKYPDDFMNKIICADCLDVMRLMPDKCVDLILTDPPYGIGITKRETVGTSNKTASRKYEKSDWDNEIPSKECFDEMARISKNMVIWGGNYFVEYLHNSRCWLVWDKDNTGNFADCELAWTSFDTSVRKFRYRWNGMIQENMKNKEERFHPTQKPTALFKWVLNNYSKENYIVCDPFLGSGTAAAACKDMGRTFIGIERESKYCRMAEERIRILDMNPKFL
jgi:site-specific DNA-methyltransferase (adenine-specific)